jgi:hypothetical protein
MESAKVRIGHQADRTNSARVAREEVQMHLMRSSKPQGRFGRGLWLRLLAGVVALALAGVLAGGAIAGDGGHRSVFRQINLISDIDGVARITDPNLVNPWGMAAGPTTPLWIFRQRRGRFEPVHRRCPPQHPADRAAGRLDPAGRADRDRVQLNTGL